MKPVRSGLQWLAAVALAAALATQGAAADLALTLTNGSQRLDLTIDELAAMPQTTLTTENEFADGKVAYRGPLVRDVLAKGGLEDATDVRFVAANDYYVDIPTQDFRDYDAILAMEANGERLSRRDKGPLWLMYPISDFAALRDPMYTRRLIWQVVRIDAQ